MFSDRHVFVFGEKVSYQQDLKLAVIQRRRRRADEVTADELVVKFCLLFFLIKVTNTEKRVSHHRKRGDNRRGFDLRCLGTAC